MDAFIENISPGNKALLFIENRLRNDDCNVSWLDSQNKLPEGDVKTFVFSKNVDSYLNGHLELLLEFFLNADTNIKNISFHEYMFFASAMHTQTAFAISIQECIELIKLYRTLAPTQKKAVVNKLQLKHSEKFNNMKINAEQIFSLLSQTVYFSCGQEKLIPLKI